MTEESDRKDADRGRRAQALLDNKLLWECFDKIEAEYIAGWKATQLRDTDGRERAFLAVHVVGAVRSHLEKMVADGELAKATIEQVTRTTAAHRK